MQFKFMKKDCLQKTMQRHKVICLMNCSMLDSNFILFYSLLLNIDIRHSSPKSTDFRQSTLNQ